MHKETVQSPPCEDCEYWYPYHILPIWGVCKHLDCPCRQMVLMGPTESCKDFRIGLHRRPEERLPLDRFYWCKTCRQTIYGEDLASHNGHRIYRGAAAVVDEESAELTLAGD